MSAATATDIPFGDAYDELKAITEKLNNEEVEADQLVDLLRRGKGLESALREHLTGIEQEVTAIESGKGITPYRIVDTRDADSETADVDLPADSSDFADSSEGPSGSGPLAGSADDIPF